MAIDNHHLTQLTYRAINYHRGLQVVVTNLEELYCGHTCEEEGRIVKTAQG